MFKGKDIKTIGDIHNEIQKASADLNNIENCKTNDYCKKLRFEARAHFYNGRRKLRELKRYILNNDWRR